MKLKFELTKSPGPSLITWKCVEGYGFYGTKGITPGSTITFSRNYFWRGSLVRD